VSVGGRIPLEAALVRLWREGVPVGAGFLAGPEHILTAAHVVATALGMTDAAVPPVGATVEFDFPFLAPGTRHTARVVLWAPEATGAETDIAGLTVLDPLPADAQPLPLARHRSMSADELIMVGFPKSLELGSWIYGRPGGPVSTGWVELHSDPTHPSTVEPGFSGTPVWHTDLDAAVGMVVRAVRGAPPKIGYMIPADALLASWPALRELGDRTPPFRGLRPFTEQDADRFAGREDDIERLVAQIRSAPLICVIGASGVGKSSLLSAGVLPMLRSQPGVVVATLRPSDAATPVGSLAAALEPLLPADPAAGGDPLDRPDRVARLAQLLESDPVGVVAAVRAGARVDRLVITIDQFEEIFEYSQSEQEALARVLRALYGPDACTVLVLRDVFLAPALRSPGLVDLAAFWVPVTVTGLTREQLRRAITGPATAARMLTFEPGLVDRILDDLDPGPGSLALLQFTLSELWHRRRGTVLTHRVYEELGGVRGALAGYAEGVWDSLDPAAQRAARRLLVQLAHPLPDHDLPVRRTAPRHELDEPQWTVAQRLATTRLAVLRGGSVPGVELAHESLLTHWDRLRTMVRDSRGFRLWQENVRQRMARWKSENSAAARLLSGVDLREANQYAKSRREDLSVEERRFVALSVRRRRVRVVRAGLALLLVVVAILVTYRTTGQQRTALAAADLAGKAQSLAPYDRYGALQLALRAYRTDGGVQFGPSLKLAYPGVDRVFPDYTSVLSDRSRPAPSGASPSGATLPPTAGSTTTGLTRTVNADGHRMVTTDSAGHAALWNLTGNGGADPALGRLFHQADHVSRVAMSRSGRYVAFVEQVFPFLDLTRAVHGPVDSNGLPVVRPGDYRTCPVSSLTEVVTCLVVYDVEAHTVTMAVPVGGIFAPISGIVIDPTDQVVALTVTGSPFLTDPASTHNTMILWDLRSGQRRREVILPWQAWISEVWLGPGAATAIMAEFIPSVTRPGLPDRWALSSVDLGPTPRRHELCASMDQVTMSLDWTRAAVIAHPLGHNPYAQVIDARTGAIVATTAPLSAEEARGALALDATGSLLMLDWYPTPGLTATDIRDIGRSVRQLSLWSLSDGTRLAPVYQLDSVWPAVLPLGTGIDAPVALLDTSAIALTRSDPGQDPALRRLTAAANTATGAAASHVEQLCTLLADPNDDQAVRGLWPPDTYQEELCPS
jgi:hypothetical protein